jgi:hypothetical protein
MNVVPPHFSNRGYASVCSDSFVDHCAYADYAD